MKKINNYVIYKAFCDIMDEGDFDEKDVNAVEQHMKNMIYSYARKNDIKFEADENIKYKLGSYKGSIDCPLEGVWDDVKQIFKTEESDPQINMNDEEIKELLEVTKDMVVSPVISDLEPVTGEQYKSINNKLDSKINDVYSVLEYKPPFLLKLVKFIPTVKNIINFNEQKYRSDKWKSLPDDIKTEFVSNLNIKQCVKILQK